MNWEELLEPVGAPVDKACGGDRVEQLVGEPHFGLEAGEAEEVGARVAGPV